MLTVKRIVTVLAAVLLVLGVGLLAPQQAHAATYNKGTLALIWAEIHAGGCWYSYGGTSCSPGYDCSGLVQTAVWHADHIMLPRTTYGMLADSRQLIRVYSPQRGDLAFYGSGHVEFMTHWWHTTYGAHDWGTRVGYALWGWGWVPTMFFRLR